MSKSVKITLVFVLIFLVGVLSFVAYINYTLNNPVISLNGRGDEIPDLQ